MSQSLVFFCVCFFFPPCPLSPVCGRRLFAISLISSLSLSLLLFQYHPIEVIMINRPPALHHPSSRCLLSAISLSFLPIRRRRFIFISVAALRLHLLSCMFFPTTTHWPVHSPALKLAPHKRCLSAVLIPCPAPSSPIPTPNPTPSLFSSGPSYITRPSRTLWSAHHPSTP